MTNITDDKYNKNIGLINCVIICFLFCDIKSYYHDMNKLMDENHVKFQMSMSHGIMCYNNLASMCFSSIVIENMPI